VAALSVQLFLDSLMTAFIGPGPGNGVTDAEETHEILKIYFEGNNIAHHCYMIIVLISSLPAHAVSAVQANE
jgi:hypothetical protein